MYRQCSESKNQSETTNEFNFKDAFFEDSPFEAGLESHYLLLVLLLFAPLLDISETMIPWPEDLNNIKCFILEIIG